ncbi:ER membrane protein complex subunit 7 beta-sandwich domain-containing protein [Entamoeba marina]
MLLLWCVIALASAIQFKGRVLFGSTPQLTTPDFVNVNVHLSSSDVQMMSPIYTNGTFVFDDIADGKYNIRVVGPQLMEYSEMVEVGNDTIKTKGYDRRTHTMNIKVNPIDFTQEGSGFSIWSLLKNPTVIIALVSIGLLGFQKLSTSALDPEENRQMKHPDIILANGERVDPTQLVPKFIE